MASNSMEDASRVLEMMEKLSIADALTISKAAPENLILQKCYEKRVDPVVYFSKSFAYPVTLMSVMFDTGCILGGSRALDYFVPGSARAESDWDFYIPAYTESVADMVSALSICGVTWSLEGTRIEEELRIKGFVTVSRVILEAWCSWFGSTDHRLDVARHLGITLQRIVLDFKLLRLATQTKAKTFTIAVDSTGATKVSPADTTPSDDQMIYEDAFGQSFNILQGSIQTDRGAEKVQLIIGSYYGGIRSGTSFIKNFYASHVQCFISGWCASHLYYHQASNRQATIWKTNDDQPNPKVLNAIEKYQRRGFTFESTKNEGIIGRSLHDGDSFFIDFSDLYRPYLRVCDYRLLDEWLVDRRKNTRSIEWFELGGRIADFQNPWQACFRTCRVTLANPESGLSENKQLRLANVIALNTQGTNMHTSKGFRSLVGRGPHPPCWQMALLARSGTVFFSFRDATPWSWVL